MTTISAPADRFAGLELRIERLEGRIRLLTWMVGVNTGLTLLVLGKLFN